MTGMLQEGNRESHRTRFSLLTLVIYVMKKNEKLFFILKHKFLFVLEVHCLPGWQEQLSVSPWLKDSRESKITDKEGGCQAQSPSLQGRGLGEGA